MVAHPADNKLTAKEEAFAMNVAAGMTDADAWRKAYGKPGATYANRNAHTVRKRPHVAARIAELRKPDEKRLFLTRARKREILMTMAESDRNGVLDRQRAIDLDNKMDGSYAQVVRIEGEITLSAVMQALAAGASPLPTEQEVIELGLPLGEVTRSVPPIDNSPQDGETSAGHTLPIKREKSAPSDGAPAGDLDPIGATPAGEPGKVRGPFDEELAEQLAPLPPRQRIRTYEE